MAPQSSLATWAAELRCRLADWIERNPEGAARIALWMEEELEHPDERAPVDLLHSFIEAVVPRNWWSMGVGLHVQAWKVMAETGVCLIWVPPGEVVEAVLRCDCKQARDEALLANSAQILDSADQALSEAVHPRLDLSVAAACEAVSAQRAGLTRAAQSLTATLLGEIVEGHFGFDDFGSARRAFEREPASSAGLWSTRRAAVQEALLMAILQSRFRPPEAGFNRHLSAHGVDPLQFRESHALEGLMLLAGTLRELHEVYRVAERGFGPSPRLSRYARIELERRMDGVVGPRDLGTRQRPSLN
jgi:hypothetical protein